MKKRIVYIGVVGCVIILLSACAYSIQDYTSAINTNWSIQLPSSYTEVYSTDDGQSFNGDGRRYHVFQYEDINDIENSLNWKTNKNTIVENQVIEIMINLDIDDMYLLNFDQTYKYVEKYDGDGSSLFLILIEDRLYVVEDIY
jgi:hypothetical protein